MLSIRRRLSKEWCLLRKLIAEYWRRVKGTELETNMPLIMRRRIIKAEELQQRKLWLLVTAVGFSAVALAAVMKINSLKKTFIRGIYFTPATNSMDFWLYTAMGSKWIKGVTPNQLEVVETVTGNNRVDKLLVVKDKDTFKGYTSFGYPGRTSWQGQEIFELWYNKE